MCVIVMCLEFIQKIGFHYIPSKYTKLLALFYFIHLIEKLRLGEFKLHKFIQ